MLYFSIQTLYSFAMSESYQQPSLKLTFSNCLFYFSIKVFGCTLLFFIIFVIFVLLIETLVYRMPRILIWSSLILPQLIIFGTQIEFPSNDAIPLTDSQTQRIIDVVSNLHVYASHLHQLICLYHNGDEIDEMDDIDIDNRDNIDNMDNSLHIVLFTNESNSWNCYNQTAIEIERMEMENRNRYREYGILSFSWSKLLFFIVMFIGYNYLFDCKCIYSSFFALITVVSLLWIFGRGSSGNNNQEITIKNNYEYCKLLQTFKDSEMEPIDRFLKLKKIFNTIEINNNHESEMALQSLEKYIIDGPYYVPQNEFYHKPFSLNLNEWCLKGDNIQCINALIDGVNTIETVDAIANRKRMYNAGGDIYKMLLMIVAILWSYLCDILINISRNVYTEWRKRLLLYQYLPVDDVCDLIMRYSQTV